MWVGEVWVENIADRTQKRQLFSRALTNVEAMIQKLFV